jgi:glycosyltransferase involved in cell wall biosynthesis
MNVLFLTKYPRDGASSRYRVWQYLPFLDAAGIGYDVQSFMSPAMYRRVNAPGATAAKIAHTVVACARRLAQLARARRYDLVFMQRECLPWGPPVMERCFRRWGIPTIFDYDDALFLFKPSTHNALADAFKRPGRLGAIVREVDRVLAGNDWLRDRAIDLGADARTFPVAEDLARYTPRPPHGSRAPFVIGWLGSPSTEKYLELIREPLRLLCRRHPQLRLVVVGGGSLRDAALPIEHVAWSLADEVAQLHRFDIGLMPLPADQWSLGKSGGKARTYMAVGVPAVCTDIGFNRELIRDGETGFLVSTDAQWTGVLERLIDDAALRERIARAARRDVEARFALADLGPRFVEQLREVARDGRD